MRRWRCERGSRRDVPQTVFDDGFFHGDAHPGNFFVHPEGAIAMIDFGIVGTLDSTSGSERS